MLRKCPQSAGNAISETLNSKIFSGGKPPAPLRIRSLNLKVRPPPLSRNPGSTPGHYDVIRAPKTIFCPGPHKTSRRPCVSLLLIIITVMRNDNGEHIMYLLAHQDVQLNSLLTTKDFRLHIPNVPMRFQKKESPECVT